MLIITKESKLHEAEILQEVAPLSLRTRRYIRAFNKYMQFAKQLIAKCEAKPEMRICQNIKSIMPAIQKMKQLINKLKNLDTIEFTLLKKKKAMANAGQATTSLNVKLEKIKKEKSQVANALHICIKQITS